MWFNRLSLPYGSNSNIMKIEYLCTAIHTLFDIMDRRSFLHISAAGIAGLTLCGSLPLEAADKHAAGRGRRDIRLGKDGYSVVMLGDTHYDAAPVDRYHTGYSDPNPVREKAHRDEFQRNWDMWSERCPRLVDRASRLVDRSTRLQIQVGDLIQGDCGSKENHERMLDDAFTMLKSRMDSRLPLVTVIGNHDARGRDDSEAYAAYTGYMPAKMSAELGKEISKTTFSFMIGKDAYIVIDFTHPDDAEVEKAFRETEGARYTFVVVHAPVLPYDSLKYYNWIYHGREATPDARLHFRELFAKRNVIVLCGHSHTTELADWYGDGGRITQMTMSSVWKSAQTGRYAVNAEGAAEYGALRLKAAAKAGAEVKPESIAWFDEYRPGLKTYVHSNAAGSYRMNVSDRGVTVEFFAGDSESVSETFVLR